MVSDEMLVCEALKGHIRVNKDLGTVEIFDEFGVAMVLRNLDEMTLEAFADMYQTY